MPLLNLTYEALNISSNGRRLEQEDLGDDTSEAIIKFDITGDETINISRINVENNHMRKGSVILFNPIESESNLKAKPLKNVMINNDSHFGNNTSFGPTSSVQVEGETPWLNMLIQNSSFLNNYGAITNDFWAHDLHRLEFLQNKWS